MNAAETFVKNFELRDQALAKLELEKQQPILSIA